MTRAPHESSTSASHVELQRERVRRRGASDGKIGFRPDARAAGARRPRRFPARMAVGRRAHAADRRRDGNDIVLNGGLSRCRRIAPVTPVLS